MRIVIGSDHGGLELKRTIAAHLRDRGYDVDDIGTHTEESVDYPDIAHVLACAVVHGAAERGVLVCGTGQGVAISANKNPGIRAAPVGDTYSARMACEHNDANVLCLGQRVTGPGLACDIVDAWLGASFAGGRHARRVAKIEGR